LAYIVLVNVLYNGRQSSACYEPGRLVKLGKHYALPYNKTN